MLSPEEQVFILNKAHQDLVQYQDNLIQSNIENFRLLNHIFGAMRYHSSKSDLKGNSIGIETKKSSKHLDSSITKTVKDESSSDDDSSSLSSVAEEEKGQPVIEQTGLSNTLDMKEAFKKENDAANSGELFRKRVHLKDMEEKDRVRTENEVLYRKLCRIQKMPRKTDDHWKRHKEFQQRHLEGKRKARETCRQHIAVKDAVDRQTLDKYAQRVAEIDRKRRLEAKQLALLDAKHSQFVHCADFIRVVHKISDTDVATRAHYPPCSVPCEPCPNDPDDWMEMDELKVPSAGSSDPSQSSVDGRGGSSFSSFLDSESDGDSVYSLDVDFNDV